MGNGVEILSRLLASDPQTLLRSSLKSGIVPFALRSQGVDRLKSNGIPLDGKSGVVRERDIFRTACSFGTLVETFVVARTVVQMGSALIRTAVFLPCSAIVGEFAVPVHCQSCFTNGSAARNLVQVLRIAFIERNHTITVVNIMHGIVDSFYIVGFICNKGAFLHGQILVGFLEDIQSNSRICHICGGGQFADRKPGNAIHQNMIFVTPIKRKIALIVLI